MLKMSQKKTMTAVLALLAIVLLATVAMADAPRLMAAFFVKGKVGLKWAPVSGASEYLVYRAGPDGEFNRIASLNEDKYFDETIVGGTTYIYKIAVDMGAGLEYSGTKSVTIPGVTGAFHSPEWVGIRYDQNRIFLNWDPVPGAIAYNVWRSETPGSGYEIVGTPQGSRYVDKEGLVQGKTYYYVLSAMNGEFEETPQSDERSLQCGANQAELDALKAKQSKVHLKPFPVAKAFELTQSANGHDFNQPSDVCVNSAGQIFVTDVLNGVVDRFEPSGKFSASFGRKISGNYPDGNYPDGEFLMPFTIAIDKNDDVYVSDIGRHDIQVFGSDGKFKRVIHVGLKEGQEGLRANGLAVLKDGRLVMTDAGNHQFLVTDANGKVQMSTGKRGTEEGDFIFPDQLTVDASGTVSIVDPINCRIQQFDLQGKFLRAFGEVGQSAGTFGRPKGISVDQDGDLWVSDGMSNLLQRFTPQGEVVSVLGTADDGLAFTTPRGICFKDGHMFVVERLKNKVSVYSVGP